MINITVKEAKSRLAEFIRKAEGCYSEYVITRNGKPVAALISFDELESIKETLDLENDIKLIKELRSARKRAKQNKGMPWKSIKRELLV